MAGDVKSFLILFVTLLLWAGTICGAQADPNSNAREAYRLRLDADVYLKTKDYAKAEQLFRQANALDDRNVHGLINLAYVCMEQGKPREAVGPLQRASEIEPNDADIKVRLVHAYRDLNDDRSALNVLDALQRMPLDAEDKEYTLSNLGYIQSRNKRHAEAARAYRELTLLKPNNEDYLYNLIDSYRDAGQYGAASNLITVFLARFPNSKHAPYLKSQGSKLVDEKKPASWYGRWSERSMPLKVCLLDPTKPVKGYQQNFRALVGRAIATWQTQTRGLVSFQFVATPAQADIVIEWTDDIDAVAMKQDPKDKEEHNIGFCQMDGLDARGNFTKAKVSLLTVSPHDKVPYKDLIIESIALHEFGHALGLPHSSNPADVMFPWQQNAGNDRTKLSAADVGRVVQLYTFRRPGAGTVKTLTPATKTVKSANSITAGK